MDEDSRGSEQVQVVEAARAIERCWCSYRDRQIFKLLKYAICAAEHSLTKEVIRKISPTEAQLLNDPTCHAKIRFRFGGSEYPPMILFKVFIKCGENGVKYYSGKKMIRAASKAAEDSCKLMGNRQFYNQMIIDACQQHQDKITNELDINTMKDVMQYLSNLDECPPENGGKSNCWRQLTLDSIPRHNIVHDVVTYINSGNVSERLVLETPFFPSAKPVTQKAQLQTFLGIVNSSNGPAKRKPLYRPPQTSTTEKSTARRSHRARKRVEKMKKIYAGVSTDENDQNAGFDDDGDQQSTNHVNEEKSGSENSDWENEADELYEWSQDLTLDALGLSVTTPVF
ncbi:putative uncharacterized protein CXorf58 [Dendronephthya gigantea]|uniref:putative uncharacterized protein CXorf58 n=1 Tax=Dendronephthya gigantea TaxID=151771 RepID=UPI00106BF78D|nr:putative uncharacterized protein CXorf58 [Dendronephthya gigantea]